MDSGELACGRAIQGTAAPHVSVRAGEGSEAVGASSFFGVFEYHKGAGTAAAGVEFRARRCGSPLGDRAMRMPTSRSGMEQL